MRKNDNLRRRPFRYSLVILIATLVSNVHFAIAFLPNKAGLFHAKDDRCLFDSLSTVGVNQNESTPGKKRKLSRPERKALERASNARKKSKKKNYGLHSTAVSNLHSGSSTEDVIRAIKRAQKMHDVHDIRVIAKFLTEETDETFAYGFRGSLLSRLAVAALRLNYHDGDNVARLAIELRRKQHKASMLPMESAAIIRGLLRVHNVTDALDLLEEELPLPPLGANMTDSKTRELLKHRSLSLASIASRHFFELEPSWSVVACEQLAEVGPLVRASGLKVSDLNMPWSRLIRGASQCEAGRRNGTVTPCEGVNVDLPCHLVYSVLNAMSTFPSENSDRVFEGLSNALVRRVVFITGAVDMKGCPKADRGEAAFIGRSNVGKSSLVNMVTNRKSLAYTSKRPGKTQQFNFFAVNDKPGREKEIRYGDFLPGQADSDTFYLVDLPGFGFAKVPQKQRDEWSQFMTEYISTRKTLRVIFHLVDARHGPTDEDKNIMKQIGENLPSYVRYVIVLTKADKNVRGANTKNAGKVSNDVMNDLRDAARQNGVGKSPVILSSSETKLGRDDLWRYLRLAAEA